MKLLIVTADKATLTWDSINEKVEQIRRGLNNTPGASWQIEIVHSDLRPVVDERGRITHKWYNSVSYPYFKQGYHLVYLHFNSFQWQRYGMARRYRGFNQIDTDFVGESYGWSDERTIRTGGQSQFVQTILHECSHELARATGVPDNTHPWHDMNPDISGIFRNYDMLNWQPVYREGLKKQISLLQQIVELLSGSVKYERLLPLHWHEVSQPYGVYSPNWYPITGHHIGVDFATPVGTPVVAPAKGEVTEVGHTNALGYWCTFKAGRKYFFCCHLQKPALLGTRERGWVIAFSGNTGESTGPHLHLEVWNRPVVRSSLTRDNWRDLTEDVLELIK